MNKLIFIFGYFMFFINISNGKDSFVVKWITIRYINLGTDTQHDISCSDLDAYEGKGNFMIKKLRSTVQINLFMKSLGNYKAPPLTKNIDVRANCVGALNGWTKLVNQFRFCV